MIGTGVGYALLAACFGGTYMLSVKRYLDGVAPSLIAVGSSLVAVALYLPVVFVTATDPIQALTLDVNRTGLAVVFTSIFLSMGGKLLFLSAIDSGEVSYVAPLGKTVPAFVLPFEILLIGVVLKPLQAVGIFVVVGGVYLTNFQKGRIYDPLVRLVTSLPAKLALGSAVVFGLNDVLQRAILQVFGVNPFLWVVLRRLGVALLLLPVVLRLDIVDIIRSRWRGFLIVGGLNVGLAHFATFSYSLLQASVASPIINAQSIVAVLLGGTLLKESAFRYRIAGAILTVAGIVLIVTG